VITAFRCTGVPAEALDGGDADKLVLVVAIRSGGEIDVVVGVVVVAYRGVVVVVAARGVVVVRGNAAAGLTAVGRAAASFVATSAAVANGGIGIVGTKTFEVPASSGRPGQSAGGHAHPASVPPSLSGPL
jgi:hypothetical protein